jgi:hypothetical protein
LTFPFTAAVLALGEDYKAVTTGLGELNTKVEVLAVSIHFFSDSIHWNKTEELISFC